MKDKGDDDLPGNQMLEAISFFALIIVSIVMFAVFVPTGASEGTMDKIERSLIVDTYSDNIIDEIVSAEDSRYNWDKKISFSNGEVVYVNIVCKNKIKMSGFKEGSKIDYKTEGKEVGECVVEEVNEKIAEEPQENE